MIAIGFDIGGSSVKAALVDHSGVVATARSSAYTNPSTAELAQAMKTCVDQLAPEAPPKNIGLCLPGVLDESGSRVSLCVNIPALQGVELAPLLAQVAPRAKRPRVFADAHAAGFGYWHEHPCHGRLLALALGTGVGACVLDHGQFLRVTGESSGHIGQVDVGFCGNHGENDRVGPDGGRNSLEAWIGIPALRNRYGDDLPAALETLTVNQPPIVALTRAVRVCHAIYQPDRVALIGGIGIRLKHLAGAIKSEVDRDLTSVAKQNWTLHTGTSDFHAAIGAALLTQR